MKRKYGVSGVPINLFVGLIGMCLLLGVGCTASSPTVDLREQGDAPDTTPVQPETATPAVAEVFTGMCVGVTDGDTIKVLHDGQSVIVRLHGIDAPESHQEFGTESTKFLSDLVYDKELRVEPRSTGYDKYGRFIGEIILATDVSANHESVRAGMSWWYREYAPDDNVLKSLEEEAREAKRGLWANASPIAPWDFRHGVDTPQSSSSGTAPDSGARGTTSPDRSQAEIAVTVYVTRTGSKYHRAGCRYLRSSQFAMEKSSALSGGYSPCSVCNP